MTEQEIIVLTPEHEAWLKAIHKRALKNVRTGFMASKRAVQIGDTRMARRELLDEAHAEALAMNDDREGAK